MGVKGRDEKYHGWKTAERDKVRAWILHSADHDAGWQLGIETPLPLGDSSKDKRKGKGRDHQWKE